MQTKLDSPDDMLLEQSARFNLDLNAIVTAFLHQAAKNGKSELVKLLLEEHANIDRDDYALELAALEAHGEVVALLLDHNISPSLELMFKLLQKIGEEEESEKELQLAIQSEESLEINSSFDAKPHRMELCSRLEKTREILEETRGIAKYKCDAIEKMREIAEDLLYAMDENSLNKLVHDGFLLESIQNRVLENRMVAREKVETLLYDRGILTVLIKGILGYAGHEIGLPSTGPRARNAATMQAHSASSETQENDFLVDDAYIAQEVRVEPQDLYCTQPKPQVVTACSIPAQAQSSSETPLQKPRSRGQKRQREQSVDAEANTSPGCR